MLDGKAYAVTGKVSLVLCDGAAAVCAAFDKFCSSCKKTTVTMAQKNDTHNQSLESLLFQRTFATARLLVDS